MDIVVYGKDGCKWCDKLDGYLEERQVPHVKVNVLWSPETIKEFREKCPGATTVPQVVVDGRPIGGYHESLAWFNDKFER
jgi:glutaredoxin 3